MRLTPVIAAFLLVATSAQGANPRCRLRLQGHPVLEFTGFKDVDAETRIQKTISRMKKLVSKRIGWPDSIQLELLPEGDWADFINDVVRLPVLYRSSRSTEIVIVHELTHAIFNAFMKKLVPRSGDPSPLARGIYIPYSELFSDMTVAAYFHDGHAPAEPLTAEEGAEYRDFTRAREVRGWTDEGAYSLLSPAGSWIWTHALSQARSDRERSEILESLALVIADQFRDRLDLDAPQMPEEINRNLIQALIHRRL